MFIHSGLFGDTQVSYDSTSATSGPHMGRYYGQAGWIDFPKQRHPDYDYIYGEVMKDIPWFQHDIDTFYEGLNTAAKVYEKKHGSLDPVLESFIAFITTEIANFMRNVQEVVETPTACSKWCNPIQIASYLSLLKVKNLADFKHWEHQAGRYLDSNNVPPHAPATLEGLFE
jgi:hypothetical protein